MPITPLFSAPMLLLLLALVLIVAVVSWRRHRLETPRAVFRSIVTLLVLLGFAAAFFWRVLFTFGVLMPIGGGDLNSFFYPIYTSIYHSIHNGEFPLWNPFTFSGIPLAADVQSGMFYPPNLLAWYLLPDYNYGTLEWLLIWHYLWASLGAFLLLRAMKLSRIAAWVGAGAFAYCGFMAAHFGHMPMIFTATWLPWHLLLARRTILGKSWVWPILAGLALGAAFLAGHPQTFLYECLALALYWVFLLNELRQEQPVSDGVVARLGQRLGTYGWLLQPLARAALALALFAGLSAIQLLPSSELASQSLRADISFEQASEHSVQPIGLLTLILPGIFGTNPQDYWVSWQSTENWGHLGVLTVLLAGLGIILRRNKLVGFFCALGALALLIMVGPFSAVFDWVHGLLPGFDRFRAPGRMLLVLGLAAAGLAAVGLDALLRMWSRWQLKPASGEQETTEHTAERANFRWSLYAISGGLAALALIAVPVVNAIFLSSYSLERAQQVLNEVNMLVVWLALGVGILWAAYKQRLNAVGAAVLLGALLLIDVFSANSVFNPTSTNILSGYQQTGAIAAIQQRLPSPYDGRIDSDTGVEALWQPMTSMLAGIPDAGGLYNPLQLQRYTDFWNTIKDHRDNAVYDMLNIRFMVTMTPTVASQTKWERIYNGADGLKVYQNNNAFPRVFLMHDAVVEPDDTTALGKLINGTYLPWHTLVLASGTGRSSKTLSTVEKNPNESAAMLLPFSSNMLTAQVNATEPGWAVFSEVWYPGWEATLDGQPVPIERANVALRAIAVPAGQHTIEMRFRPAPLIEGAWITGITLALALIGLIAAAVFALRQRRSITAKASS